MTTSWWYESAIYDLDNVVALARLTVRDDGSAQILTDGGETIEFEGRDDADIWLSSEEYYRLDMLHEMLSERGIAIDPRIRPPCASCEGDLVKQMVIQLD